MGEQKEQWHRKYKNRFMERAGFTEEEAQNVLEAVMGSIDYSECPIEAADSEMSYFGD